MPNNHYPNPFYNERKPLNFCGKAHMQVRYHKIYIINIHIHTVPTVSNFHLQHGENICLGNLHHFDLFFC